MQPTYSPLYRKDHQCDTKFKRNVIVIGNNGQHEQAVEVCKCEDEGATFVRFGLWPASTENTRVAFEMSLLDLQRVLQLEAHVSLYAFCKTLKHLTSDDPDIVTVSEKTA